MLLRLLQDLFGDAASREARRRLEARLHFEQGIAAREQGRHREALAELTRAIKLAPGDSLVQQALDMAGAQARFEGEFYFQVLLRILEAARPRTYLEIGVAAGDSLRLVRPPTLAIGVDPAPTIAGALEPNQRVFAETSDAFFAAHDVRAEFGGLPIDLAFIDGMHHFEYALRDFANIERLCTPRSTILIHDTYPLDRATAERERLRMFWSGDVWRLVVLLKKHRPELRIHTIATAPTGLTLVRNLNPESRLLLERHDELCREYLALDYSFIERDMPAKLNLFPNDWSKVSALLA